LVGKPLQEGRKMRSSFTVEKRRGSLRWEKERRKEKIGRSLFNHEEREVMNDYKFLKQNLSLKWIRLVGNVTKWISIRG